MTTVACEGAAGVEGGDLVELEGRAGRCDVRRDLAIR